MKLLFSTLGIFMLVCALIGAGMAFLGQRSPTDFNVTHTVAIDADREVVWAALTNVSTLTERYDDITSVELIEADALGAVLWKVLRGDTSVMVYRRAVARPQEFLEVMIEEGENGGNMGITGGYTYDLSINADGATVLSATENTRITDIGFRAAFALAGGRDQVIKAQLAEIKAISEARSAM